MRSFFLDANHQGRLQRKRPPRYPQSAEGSHLNGMPCVTHTKRKHQAERDHAYRALHGGWNACVGAPLEPGTFRFHGTLFLSQLQNGVQPKINMLYGSPRGLPFWRHRSIFQLARLCPKGCNHTNTQHTTLISKTVLQRGSCISKTCRQGSRARPSPASLPQPQFSDSGRGFCSRTLSCQDQT